MRILILSVFVLSCLLPSFAQDAFFNSRDLFIAGEGGYEIFRIPGMVVTSKGTLLAYCEARKSGSDWGRIDVMMRRSTDGGITWSPMKKIVEPPADAQLNPVAAKEGMTIEDNLTINNPLAIADQSGAVHFLYCIEYGRCFYMRSDDDGLTFSSPIEITSTFDAYRPEYDWHVLATGPNHGIQLKNGRLVVPVWLSTGEHGHRPSCVTTIYSDDHGATWLAGDIIVNNSDLAKNPSETLALQLADGRVMVNMRNESPNRRRLVSISPDGATNWTTPVYNDALFEPTCMAGLTRYSTDKNRILFVNPDNQYGDAPAQKPNARQNLVIKMSYDEGETWPIAKILDPGLAAYSDIIVGPDQTVYCLYERGDNETNKGYRFLTLARFNLAWLMDGENK
ncbi:MAG: sialidase family protein [Candidatus Hinthialibacter antarcticus]|nr:sialidase family protein [Candidatus Hinthialibacter antarcticus]